MRRLLFFYANWCGPCKRVKSGFLDALAAEHPDRVEKINVDEKAALAERYGVHRLPAFVLLDGKRVCKKIEGFAEEEELRTWLHEA